MAHRAARGLRAGIERYFTAREEEDRFPTEAGLLLELGLSEAEYAGLLDAAASSRGRACGAWTGSRTGWSRSPAGPRAA